MLQAQMQTVSTSAMCQSTSGKENETSQSSIEASQSSIEADHSVGDASTSSQCDTSITELQQRGLQPKVSSTPQVKPPRKRRLEELWEEPGHSDSNITEPQEKIARTSDASTSNQRDTSITVLQQGQPEVSLAPQVNPPRKRCREDLWEEPEHSDSNITEPQAKIARTSDASTSNQRDTSITEQEFQPKDCSTPQQAKTQLVKETLYRFLTDGGQSRNISKVPELEDTSKTRKLPCKKTQTLSNGQGYVRPSGKLEAPLTLAEEILLTQMIRIKLSQSKDNTVVCKTGGAPLVLRKIIVPKKPSSIASEETKRRRALEINCVRKATSGSKEADEVEQKAAELRTTRAVMKRKVLNRDKIKHRYVSAKTAARMQIKGLLSISKMRDIKRVVTDHGLKFESEHKQDEFQKKLLIGETVVESCTITYTDRKSETEKRIKGHVVKAKDLPGIVTNMLNQYQQKNMLTWHSEHIPESEIWLKIGGDFGGSSFKCMLSTLNVERPNATENCFMILMAEAKDNPTNLRTFLEPLREEINELKSMSWNGKSMRLFMCGDYDFQVKMYGLSGAAGVHPCLWCDVTKEELQEKPTERREVNKRTLESLQEHHESFQHEGHGDKKRAKEHMNVVMPLVWDIPVRNVAPPYLHIFLGVVQKHHKLLEDDVFDLDKRICLDMVKDTSPSFDKVSAAFKESVLQVKRRCRVEKRRIRAPEDLGDPFKKHEGPVAQRVEKVLKDNCIKRQAYHSGSFVGNHCNKYMKYHVYYAICSSIEAETYFLSENQDTWHAATEIKEKYLLLNDSYAKVHRLVSSVRPVDEDDARNAKRAINAYLQAYRAKVSWDPKVNVLPKQHILESHVAHWMRRWKFGLGLHGEQGLESLHAWVNRLKARSQGIKSVPHRLAFIMKQQWMRSSPMLLDSPKKASKPKED